MKGHWVDGCLDGWVMGLMDRMNRSLEGCDWVNGYLDGSLDELGIVLMGH
jgi:hypothetical protein